MSFWTSLRDTFESAASLAGNYFYPGSGLITGQMTSKGSQKQLGSTAGQLAMLGTGVSGGLEGNMSNYGALMSSAGLGGNAPSLVEDSLNTVGGIPSGDAAAQAGMESGTGGYGPQSTKPDDLMSKLSSWTKGLIGPSTPATGTPGAGVAASTGTAGGAGSMPWGSPSNLMTMGSGIYGLIQSNRIQQLAKNADPFGPYREQFAERASNLAADPNSIFTMPGYAAGETAVKRQLAPYGQDSGAMLAALRQYGGDFYNQTMNQYANLGGSAISPAVGGQLALGGVDLAGRSLATLGYGAARA